ncbi:helix-turn-helix domain-containing protein [Haloechinothrix salitolerans]|uniref:Helix-turn-helix domain-containing protein n=1 Tax=Haloechinothrix salitolerans TaxID=926830 RepID=A0ABW2BVK3_9PSEU
MNDKQLLSTGQAAEVLGCSRQHVVDLCSSGQLPYVTVGAHRRIRRADAEAFLQPPLRRDEERSLWLHQVVAGRLATDTASVMETAHENMRHLRHVHPDGMATRWLDHWEELLNAGPDAVFDALTSRARWAIELRQNSPFAGVLTTKERQAALNSFRTHWKTDHAA